MNEKLVRFVIRNEALAEAIKAVEGVGKIHFTAPDGAEQWRVPSRNDLTDAIRAIADAPKVAPPPPALLPCPFCGSAPKLIEIREMPDNFVREHNIRCDECAVSIYAEYESEVVEQWNNRPGSRIKTVLDALEALTVEHSPPSGISINEATRNKAKDLVRSALSSASTFEPIPIDDDSQPIKHPDFQARVARVHAALFDDDPTDIGRGPLPGLDPAKGGDA
jgi:Lar family restriction alleviation protein